MSRTTPVHSGYTILNGSGTGPNGGRIDVWAEYKLGTQSASGNYTPITAYFYAALNPSYSSTTSYASGLSSQFKVNGAAGTGVSNGAYDFTGATKVNLLGSYSGNISHNTDGTKTVDISGSFTTASSYITGGSVSGSIKLPTIPRAATITSAPATALGSTCAVKWTPASSGHTYALDFSLGSWSKRVTGIAPKRTTAYSHTVAIPLEAARQFTAATAKMTVKLTTYNGASPLGSDSETFTVTVPDSEETRPRVSAVLTPASTPFAGLYIQGHSKVGAVITATDPYGASVTACKLAVEGKGYAGAEAVSDFITGSGTCTVTASATNSRGFTGTVSMDISVTPYTPPRLTAVSACRCDSQGTAAEDGECLYLSANAEHSDVQGLNTCAVRWRIKPEKGEYTDWQDLTQGVVMEGALYKDTAYTVQLEAADTVGNRTVTTVSIASEAVYMHRPAGGTGLGLGGYVGEDDLLDIYWRVNARKPLTAPSVNYRGFCTDVSSAVLPGVYRLTSDTVGSPCGEGLLLVYNASESGQSAAAVFQLVVSTVGKIYTRIRWNGTPYPWKTVTT